MRYGKKVDCVKNAEQSATNAVQKEKEGAPGEADVEVGQPRRIKVLQIHTQSHKEIRV